MLTSRPHFPSTDLAFFANFPGFISKVPRVARDAGTEGHNPAGMEGETKKTDSTSKDTGRPHATDGHDGQRSPRKTVPRTLKHHAKRAYPGLHHGVRILAGTALIILVMTPTGELARYNVQGALIGALALLAVLLGLFIVFLRWRLTKLDEARYPGWAALELYTLAVVMFLAIFSKLYLMVSLTNPQAFTEQLNHFTAYYFALTVLATVGFGDITPITVLARSLTMVQMALDLTFLALLVRLVSTHRQRAHAAKSARSTS